MTPQQTVTVRIHEGNVSIETSSPVVLPQSIAAIADRRRPIVLAPDFTKVDSRGDLVSADAEEFVAVVDHNTGLMWSSENVTDKKVDHATAEQACKDLTLAGHSDWRLPTIRELQTLVDHSRHEPAIDIRFFPTCRSDWYWSATPTAWSSAYAWLVNFGFGYAGSVHRGYYGGFVRAVRAVAPGQ